ncbi:MAG: hypothetical protein FWD64_08970 [Acidobacteriaceae bacterium]|nr:hypothetical protein [Acidobacteriaceae bacterium]
MMSRLQKTRLRGAITLLALAACLWVMPGCREKNNHQQAGPESPGFNPSRSMPSADAQISQPVPSQGETLYTGSANIHGIDSFQMSFLLSADKKQVSNFTMVVEGLRYSYQRAHSETRGMVGKMTSRSYTSYPVQPRSSTITFGNSTLTGLTFTSSGAYATMNYVYETEDRPSSSSAGSGIFGGIPESGEKVLIPFPSARIVFKATQ